MRKLLLVLVIAVALTAPAAAVKLETAATVELIDPALAQLDHWRADARPAWTLTGAPDEHLQVSLELRTADGRHLTVDRGESLTLDQDGRALATLAAPATAPHETIDLVTLVVCRE